MNKILENKRIALVLLLTAILMIAGAIFSSNYFKPPIHVDYPYYANLEALFDRSSIIVVAEVEHVKGNVSLKVNSDVESMANKDDLSMIYTVSSVRVLDVLKGDILQNDLISVKQLGDKTIQPEMGTSQIDGYFKAGQKYILFLRRYDNLPYSILNPWQGALLLDSDQIIIRGENPLFKTGDSLTSVEDQIIKLNP